MNDKNEDNDETDYLHARVEADDVGKLDELISEKQKEGFELVSVVHDGKTWHAFMKYSLVNCDFKILHELDALNSGVGMLINNDPNFATSGHLDELKSVLQCILSVMENRDTA